MKDVQANRLAELRERSRLTQEEVGKLLDLAPSTVSKHESGTRSLSPELVEKYAGLYKVSTYELYVNPDELKEGESNVKPNVGRSS